MLPTPHGDVHDDQGPHDPTTQSMAAREARRQRDQLRVLDKCRKMGEKSYNMGESEKNTKKEHLEPLVLVFGCFWLSRCYIWRK